MKKPPFNKGLLIAKVWELFTKYGIKKLKVVYIANHLGISKKTLYQLFHNKNELILAAINYEIKNISSQVNSQGKTAKNAIQEMMVFISILENMIVLKNSPLLAGELKKYFPSLYNSITNDESGGLIFNFLQNNIERGKAEKLYKENIDAGIMARYGIVILNLIFENNLFPYYQHKKMNAFNEITQTYLLGLLSSSGKQLLKKYQQ
jgi:Transcriptional regulator